MVGSVLAGCGSTVSQVSGATDAAADVITDVPMFSDVPAVMDVQAPTDVAPPADVAPDVAADVATDVPGSDAPVSCTSMPCGPGERRNAWTQLCESLAVPYPPPGQDNGGLCTADADCRSAAVTMPFRQSCNRTNGGDFCVSPCTLPAEWGVADTFGCSDCPAGSVCFPTSVRTSMDGLGTCVRECHADSDCRTADGYYCRRTFEGRTYTNGYCAPAHCRTRGCLGYQCYC